MCFYCCGKTKNKKRHHEQGLFWAHGCGALESMMLEQLLKDRVSKHYQQAKRTNREWHGALFLNLKAPPHLRCDKLLPAKPHLLTVPKTGNRVFKCSGLTGHFSLLPPQWPVLRIKEVWDRPSATTGLSGVQWVPFLPLRHLEPTHGCCINNPKVISGSFSLTLF